MHGIVKFIQDGEEIKKTLEIGEDEVKILRFLAHKFLSTEPSVPVSELLQRLFCGERGELSRRPKTRETKSSHAAMQKLARQEAPTAPDAARGASKARKMRRL